MPEKRLGFGFVFLTQKNDETMSLNLLQLMSRKILKEVTDKKVDEVTDKRAKYSRVFHVSPLRFQFT